MNRRLFRFIPIQYPQPNVIPPIITEVDPIKNETFSGTELELNNVLRLHWRDYLTWLRAVIIAKVFKNPDEEVIISRLFQTSKDISSVYKNFYGEDVANRFDELMTDNLLYTIELINAILANNETSIQIQQVNWIQNATKISQLYASINPFWKVEVWKPMLQGLLFAIKEMVIKIKEGNYVESINQFDEMSRYQHVLIDLVYEGLIEQFPDVFS